MGLKELKEKINIAYFSMEIGVDSNIPTYSGGLGVLSGDTLRSAADLEIPMVAVCLCYSSGYFYQAFDNDGNQLEHDIRWNFYYEFEKIRAPVKIQIQGKEIVISAWKYNVIGQSGHIIPVYLLETDVEENEPWQRELTHVLYDSTSRFHRIVQEMILGIGGVRLLKSLNYKNIDTYHMNEGHAAFLTLELLKENGGDLEKVKKKCVFTTHTPVPAGHDRFDYNLVNDVFRDELPANIKELGGKNELNMTTLAAKCSRYINGVSKKHGEVAQEMMPEFKIDYITNGVHLPFWVSEPFDRLFTFKWPRWKAHPNLLENAIELDDLELFDAHNENKFKLISYQKAHSWNLLDEELLTIGFARRFATYKRAILLFHDIDRLGKICHGNCQFIFAGKAHPKDQAGKDFIKKIHDASMYLLDNYNVKIVLMENYNMDLSHLLTAGVDVWLNTPNRYREASGTSGMKAALNGVPNFSVLDGWWLEGHKMNPLSGWAIGPDEADPEAIKNDWEKDANSIYDTLQNNILPKWMDQDEWLWIMKNAITLAAHFNTHRMIEEYAAKAYHLVRQDPWKFARK
jgi:starch phosphorylase